MAILLSPNLTYANYANQLQSWSSALSNDADILLFGCDIASGEPGNNFIHQIASLTGADVAASTNLTGNNALGGDWVLEDRTGAIEADFHDLEGYFESLAKYGV